MEKFKAQLTLITTENGGRAGYILPGYRPSLRLHSCSNECDNISCSCNLQSDCMITDFEKIFPGETEKVTIQLLFPDKFDLKQGDNFIITEGKRIVANGIIL